MNDNKEYVEHIDDNEIDLYDLMISLWKKRNLIFVFITLAAIISVSIALWLPNKYTSSAVLMPKSGSSTSLSSALGLPDMGGLSRIAGLDSGSSDQNVELAKKLFTARSFVINFLNKYAYLPEVMAAEDWDASNNEIKYDFFGYDLEADKLTYQPSDDDIYKSFLDGFNIETDRQTGFITVEYLHYSPYLARELLNKKIFEVNNDVRKREVEKLNKSVDYLNTKISETSSLELKQVFIGLREGKVKDLMLAEIDEFYVLDIVDPPNLPFLKTSPRRAVICILGTIFGGLFAIFSLLIARFFNYDIDFSFKPLKVIINEINK
ncbi:Wzz/FepE/Etk N-terminal domain-containing protein [Gammaproteobacteria bacterium]|nr:Wzz/FepE/Etk N-terminal domain-containing protein [Gammaproteobacteria bacterium]